MKNVIICSIIYNPFNIEDWCNYNFEIGVDEIHIYLFKCDYQTSLNNVCIHNIPLDIDDVFIFNYVYNDFYEKYNHESKYTYICTNYDFLYLEKKFKTIIDYLNCSKIKQANIIRLPLIPYDNLQKRNRNFFILDEIKHNQKVNYTYIIKNEFDKLVGQGQYSIVCSPNMKIIDNCGRSLLEIENGYGDIQCKKAFVKRIVFHDIYKYTDDFVKMYRTYNFQDEIQLYNSYKFPFFKWAYEDECDYDILNDEFSKIKDNYKQKENE